MCVKIGYVGFVYVCARAVRLSMYVWYARYVGMSVMCNVCTCVYVLSVTNIMCVCTALMCVCYVRMRRMAGRYARAYDMYVMRVVYARAYVMSVMCVCMLRYVA